jgi:thiol-disulfide isomerase/thioredoxin
MSKFSYLVFVLIAIFTVGCTSVASVDDGNSWRNLSLRNVQNGNEFTISEFSGRPVLIETFAVWCPTCLRQQKEIERMQEIDPYDTVHVAIDIDSNSNEEKIQEFVAEHGFDWLYAISTEAYTMSLVDEFGVKVANAPLAPVILVCGDGRAHMLPTGVKLAEELVEDIGAMCA